MLLRRITPACLLLAATLTVRAAEPSLAEDPRVASALELGRAWLDAERAYQQVPGISAAVVHDQKALWIGGFGLHHNVAALHRGRLNLDGGDRRLVAGEGAGEDNGENLAVHYVLPVGTKRSVSQKDAPRCSAVLGVGYFRSRPMIDSMFAFERRAFWRAVINDVRALSRFV